MDKAREGKRKEKKKGREKRRGGGERRELSAKPLTICHYMELHSDWSAVYLVSEVFLSVCHIVKASFPLPNILPPK